MSLGENIRRLRKAAHLTIGELAAIIGADVGNISRLERDLQGYSQGRLEAIATALNVEVADLFAGTSNVSDAPKGRRVPIISWVQAGAMADIEDPHLPGEASDWADIYDSHSATDHSFALRVSGDSMTSPIPGDLSFPEGTIIVVDPTSGGQPGDFVIAKDVVTQQATFKKLTTDGGRWFLKPLNPRYPMQEIDDPAVRIIGRVIEYQIRGKL